MKNLDTIRETIQNIILESFDDSFGHDEFGHSRDGRAPLKSNEITFPVYLADDSEVTVHVNYDERLPFEVEMWKAVDATGVDVDIDELKVMVPNLEDRAWQAIEAHYG